MTSLVDAQLCLDVTSQKSLMNPPPFSISSTRFSPATKAISVLLLPTY